MGHRDPAIPPPVLVPGPTRVRYQVLGFACSVAVIAYIHRVGFASALGAVGADLNLNDQQTSYLTAAFLIAYGGFEIPCGLLADRLGVRHLLTVLVFGWSLLTGCVALVGLVPGVWMLPLLFVLVLRFLFGMFQAGGFPSLARMIADWMPMSDRASAQGLIWMCSRVGGAVVPLLYLGLVNLSHNWQAPLCVLAGLGVLWCILFWPWFRNRPEEMPRVSAAENAVIAAGRPPYPLGHGKVPWGKMLRSRSAWALCLTYGCGGFAANFYVTLLPKYLTTQRGLPDWQKDLFTSLPFACGAVACLGAGLLSDWIIRRTGNRRWGRRLSGAVGLMAGALGWLGINGVESPWALAVLLCVIFFCNDLAMGPAWASCADIGERYAGTLGGAMNMLANLFGAAGNLVTGHLFKENHPQWVFVMYACSFALASLCWLGVDVTKPFAAKQ
jgi:sugar phosphate permease